MRFSRNSQDRWTEWEGEGLDFGPNPDDIPVYYTIGTVHPKEDDTGNLLGMKLARDGVVDTRWKGLELVETSANVIHGYVLINEYGDAEFFAEFEEDLPDGVEEVTVVEVLLGE